MTMKKTQEAAIFKRNFRAITLGILSPEKVLEISRGEVISPDTFNYKTLKPVPGGLFCEKIFGPVNNYQCACGKYKRKIYEGVVCDRCGVEVTSRQVRRERFGHIKLTVPVVHIWFYRMAQSKLSLLLDIPYKTLEGIVYLQNYVVFNLGDAASLKIVKELNLKQYSVIDDNTYWEIKDALPKENASLPNDHPAKFVAKTGSEAILELLNNIDLDALALKLREDFKKSVSCGKPTEKSEDILKRLKVVEEFREGAKQGIKPQYAVMTHILVLPPELRPMFQMNDGRFASSELNDLYRRVIVRNNRLKKLFEVKAPEIILKHGIRMLQESVDCLFDNSRSAVTNVKSSTNRPLKSLTDTIRGKYGRFRLNLLGKRVDYSGRSTIVVGPNLKMYEVGIPYEMAFELFKPMIIQRLLQKGYAYTFRVAQKLIERKSPEAWECLEELVRGYPVLLNRAPTLHRPSIQAFYVKLTDSKAIQLHPLVCAAFNADFDGDQMAVHVPLSNEAICEAITLMLSPFSIFSPANGDPIAVPSQDMILGLHYMTKPSPVKPENLKQYDSYEEVYLAYNNGIIKLHEWIKFKAPFYSKEKVKSYQWIETTAGRVIFNSCLPEGVSFINETLTKRHLKSIIEKVYEVGGFVTTTEFLDNIKKLGFEFSTKGGLSFNYEDIIVPPEKESLIKSAQQKVQELYDQYMQGFITDEERYNRTIDEWQHVTLKMMELVKKYMSEDKDGFNPIYMMWYSGARGNDEQILQVAGMRGVLTKVQRTKVLAGRETIETPILSNFKGGLTPHEYFLSTYGARKGTVDTALKTADAGYLTRRLVNVASDVVVTMEDCGTLRGITVRALTKDEDIIEPLSERIVWRVPLHDIIDPITGEIIIKEGELITPEIAKRIEESSIEEVEIRSPLTCDAGDGVCVKCYGADLTTHTWVNIGTPVGIIAAQSIGEPGTQLTLRTFHSGGLSTKFFASELYSKHDGIVLLEDIKTIPHPEDTSMQIVCRRTGVLKIIAPQTGAQLFKFNVPYASYLFVKDKQTVKKGDLLCKWDPYNSYIISEFSGIVKYSDIFKDITYIEEVDEITGLKERVIIEPKEKKKQYTPRVDIIDQKTGKILATYNLPVNARLMVEDEKEIKGGTTIARIPRLIRKIGDITGGLPRVNELFEARTPYDAAIISEIEGVVSLGEPMKGIRTVTVTSRTGQQITYKIPVTKHIIVYDGDYVEAGAPLTEGPIAPQDILNTLGSQKLQEYLVTEILNVYRAQGVKINSKHVEIIVSQMMKMVEITDAGDSKFLMGQYVSKDEFFDEVNFIKNCKVVEDPGNSTRYRKGQLITNAQLREENSILIKKGLQPIKVREAIPPTSRPIILGITKATITSESWLSGATFQNTVQVLVNAMVRGKRDEFNSVKKNIVAGKLIPAGTGFPNLLDVQVYSIDEYDQILRSKIKVASPSTEEEQQQSQSVNPEKQE